MKIKALRDFLPYEFFSEFSDTPAAKLINAEVSATHDGRVTRWPGPQKNVLVWWQLDNGKRVGWNENPSRGWSFPVLPATYADNAPAAVGVNTRPDTKPN